jgi:hypothetical protein
VERRASAFARLFEAVHEGVYIGAIGVDATSTIAANPHRKMIFGHSSETPESDVRPVDRERFVDPQARLALVARLTTDDGKIAIPGIYDHVQSPPESVREAMRALPYNEAEFRAQAVHHVIGRLLEIWFRE